MLAWGFGFWMWRLTQAHGVLFLVSAEYSAVMHWAWPGTIVTWPWLRLSMIYCCALRLWSLICITCRRYMVPGFGRPVLLCWGKMPRAKGMAAYVRDSYGAFRQPKLECGCWEILVFRNSLGSMINAGMLLASSRRLIFCGSVIALVLTGKSLFAVRWSDWFQRSLWQV